MYGRGESLWILELNDMDLKTNKQTNNQTIPSYKIDNNNKIVTGNCEELI